MNPGTIGCVWTGEFDLNTLRVDGEIFESGKKKLRIQKYPDTCGRGLRVMSVRIEHNSKNAAAQPKKISRKEKTLETDFLTNGLVRYFEFKITTSARLE